MVNIKREMQGAINEGGWGAFTRQRTNMWPHTLLVKVSGMIDAGHFLPFELSRQFVATPQHHAQASLELQVDVLPDRATNRARVQAVKQWCGLWNLTIELATHAKERIALRSHPQVLRIAERMLRLLALAQHQPRTQWELHLR
jgi:hypothetical protein